MTTSKNLHGIPVTRGVVSRAEAERFVRWRRHELLVAGLDEFSARRLAANLAVDIHTLLSLDETDDRGTQPRLGFCGRRLRS